MPLKEDKISRAFYEQSTAIEAAARMLDSNYGGIICDKNGNILYINNRIKTKEIKADVSNIFSTIPVSDEAALRIIISEGKSEVYETKQGEYLLIFPAGNGLMGITYMNLSPRNFEDLHSLLMSSAKSLGTIEHVLSPQSKARKSTIDTLSTRITRLMELLELESLTPRPYDEITYDLSELTSKLCNYISCSLEDLQGDLTSSISAAVFSRIHPEVFVKLFASMASLVMCQSESPSLHVSLSPDDSCEGRCIIRMKSNGCSKGTGMYTSFLEYACFKLGLDCSVMLDKENGSTEFSIFIETETKFDSKVMSDEASAVICDISRYISILSGRIYTHI